MLRKSPFKLSKKTTLKKVPFKKKPAVVNHKEIEDLRAFFFQIWNKRPHYCTICGTWLGNEPLSYMFDHILEKERYPELKFEEKNIITVCLDCHDCKSRGIINSLYTNIISETRKLFGK